MGYLFLSYLYLMYIFTPLYFTLKYFQLETLEMKNIITIWNSRNKVRRLNTPTELISYEVSSPTSNEFSV